jgi:hypothetical protein
MVAVGIDSGSPDINLFAQINVSEFYCLCHSFVVCFKLVDALFQPHEIGELVRAIAL